MNLLSRPLVRTLGALAGLAFCIGASAQTYPSKPIRLVVPFSAGGSTDQLARAIQKPMSEALGQPVIIENRVGAGGSIGADIVARAPADGYTLVFGNSGPSAVASLLRELPYDPVKDFQPISTVAIAPLALVSSTGIAPTNMEEFLAYARQKGSALNYGSVGNGSMSHLTGEYFNEFAGTRLQHIPYGGGSALAVSIMGGEIETAWVNPLDGTAMVESGKVRYLAVATPNRLASLPDVPSVAEFLPGFSSSAWFGVLAPAGTPAEIVAKLNAAIVGAVAQPEVRRVLESKMVEPRSTTPEEFEAVIREELAQWAPVIEKAGISM